ncbi:MAG: carboxypeptidase-like regulatory domain-containing protein [Chlorobi bacterium]|nr:carboxypeptidase-like regulatory domain-containing protein [Chlorobiota bacterium]
MKHYKKILEVIVLIIFININAGFSQENNFISIKGKILDKKTKQPIVFATITVEGTNSGTVSNTEGEFIINVEKNTGSKKIYFKYIGYKNKYVDISKLTSNENIIYLKPTSVPIKEVIVRPNNPKELVEKVIEKIPQNYSTTPNKMIAFYRETVKKKKRYVSIVEAVVEVYKAKYGNTTDYDLVKLYKGRKSSNIKAKDTLIMKLKGGPKTALLLDIAKNPRILFYKEVMDDYKFELEEIVNINDKQNYVIKFEQIRNFDYPLFNGKLYVDIKSLAISAAEYNLNLSDKAAASRLFVKKKPLFMSIEPTATKYIVKYTEDNGKYYLSYARGEVTFKCKKRLFKSFYTVMTEIAITDRTDKNVVKFNRKERLHSGIVFEEKVQAVPDTNFWGKYNTIKPEESIENAIKKYGVKLKIQD